MKITIGIDPGRINGYAEAINGKIVYVSSFKTWELFVRISTLYVNQLYDITVYIEDPTTWKPFFKGKDQSHKLKGAGSVTARFKAIIEYLEDNNIKIVRVPIQGTAKKVNAEMFMKLTGYAERTNEHGRDAAMLILQR